MDNSIPLTKALVSVYLESVVLNDGSIPTQLNVQTSNNTDITSLAVESAYRSAHYFAYHIPIWAGVDSKDREVLFDIGSIALASLRIAYKYVFTLLKFRQFMN